ncbi:hypothetical protein [Solidesulfovibrio sp.]|uniref:hypothetical protein n=1 Tax=Solidesulfovibrio sp. TaxID=2910990 RepID=UPI0026362A97|nr:hypothetical protein [Solidesulfovibrio sp.]
MIAFFLCSFLLLAVEGFAGSECARAASDQPCVNYTISFPTASLQHDGLVYLDDVVIGNVTAADQADKRTNVPVCIEQPYKKLIEQGTLAYVTKNRISIYNVWSSGTKLPEHGVIEGFSSKGALYAHELKSLGHMALRFFGLREKQQ